MSLPDSLDSNNLITPQQLSQMVGISASTLRRWESEGVFKSVRTLAGHKRYQKIVVETIRNFQKLQAVKKHNLGSASVIYTQQNNSPIRRQSDKSKNSNTFLLSKYAVLSLVVFLTGISKAYFPVEEYVGKASGIVKQEMILGITDFQKQNTNIFTPKVLGEETIQRTKTFTVNIATRLAELTVDGITTFNNNIDAIGQNLNLGTGNITAGNVIYSIKAGAGVALTGTQDITIETTSEGLVTSIGGETGDLELQAGTGIAIDGLNIENTGVTTLTGTGNQVIVSGETGSVTLSLPQNIATSSSPTFAGVTLAGDMLLNGNTTGTDIADSVVYYDASDQTQSNKVIGIKTSKTTVTDYNFSVDAQGNVYAHSLSLTGGLTLAPDLTVTDKTTLGTADGPSGWDNDFTVALGIGDYAFTYDDNVSALSLFNFNNTTDLLTIGNSSMVTSFGSNVGIGTTAPGAYKLNVNGNTNITGNLTVTGDVDSATGTIVILDGTTLTYTTGNLTTLDLGTNTIYDSNLTGNWAFNGGNLSGVGTIASGAITSTGAVQGTSLTDGTATLTSGAWAGLTGITSSGTITFSGLGTGVVQSNASGVLSHNLGTASYITKWNASGVTNANIYDNVGNIGVGGTAPATVPSLYVGANGNVGIGNTNPSYTLDITGSANLTTGNAYYINGASVLNATTLGTNIITSSLTTLGTIGTGIWEGTSVKTGYGGTGLTSYTAGDMAYYATGTALSKLGIGSSGYMLTSTGSAPQWSTITDSISSVAFIQNGNSFTANAVLGTNDSYALSFETAGVSKLYIDTTGNIGIGGTAPSASPSLYVGANGNVGIGTTGPDSKLHIWDSTINSRTYTASASNQGLLFNSFNTNDAAQTYARVGDIVALGNKDDINGGSALRFFTNPINSFVAVERLRITQSGNVGIGTTGPGSALQVSGASHTYITVQSNADSANAGIYLNGKNATTSYPALIQSDYVGGLTYIANNNGSAHQVFQTGGLERVRITSAGNVGIGTTGPLTKLHVAGSSATNVDVLTLENSDITSNVTRSITQNFVGRDTVGNQKTIASIWSRVDQINANDGSLHFGTRNANTFYSDRMVIDTNGNVGIGTTGPGAKLDVRGDARINTDAGFYATTGNPLYFGVDASPTNVGAIVPYGNNDTTYGLTFNTYTGSALTEKVRIQGNGNVGIGTTAPRGKLDVKLSTATAPAIIASAGFDSTYATFGDTSTISTSAFGIGMAAGVDAGANLLSIAPTSDWLPINYYGNRHKFFILGVEKVSIDTSGNVGIGTTAPGTLLHLEKSQNGGTQIRVINDSTGTAANSGMLWGESVAGSLYGSFSYINSGYTTSGLNIANSLQLSAASGATGGIVIKTSSASPIIFGINNSEKVRIDSSGNVGIGTTAPAGKLHISGSGFTAKIQLQNTGTGGKNWGFSSTDSGYGEGAGKLLFDDGTLVRMVIDSANGNVGIGTTGPGAKLDVYGVMRSSTSASNYAEYAQNYFRVNGSASNFFMDNATVGGENIFRVSNAGALDTTVMTMQSNGNVGIGTTAPTYKLEVVRDVTGNLLRLASATNGEVLVDQWGTTTWRGAVGDSGTRFAQISYTDASDGFLALADSNTNKVYLTANGNSYFNSGNVGIGTTGPSSKLHIYATGYPRLKVESPSGGNPGLYLVNGADSANQQRSLITHSGGNINFYILNDAEAVAYTPLQLLANGNVTMAGNVGIGTTNPGTALEIISNPANANALRIRTAGYGYWDIGTFYNNSDSDLVFKSNDSEKFRFDSSGNLMLGYTNSSNAKLAINGNVGIGTTAPSRKLEVNGNIRMGALITGAGSAVAVYRDVNGDLADSTSSIRYKDNIVTYEDILPKLEQLRTVRFDWNNQTSTPGMRDFGMIAEEVNSIFPELVNYEADGVTPRGLKYEKMGLFALKGVQELSTLITAQQLQITSLTNVLSVNNGNVGIGTTGPLAGKLHIEGQCVTGDTLLPIRRRRKKKGEGNDEDDSGLGQNDRDGESEWDYFDCRIDEVRAGDEVLSLDEEEMGQYAKSAGTIATSVSNSALGWSRVNALMDMDIKEVYEITTRSGRKIRTTSAHPYLVLVTPGADV